MAITIEVHGYDRVGATTNAVLEAVKELRSAAPIEVSTIRATRVGADGKDLPHILRLVYTPKEEPALDPVVKALHRLGLRIEMQRLGAAYRPQ